MNTEKNIRSLLDLELYQSFFLRRPYDDGTTIYYSVVVNKCQIGRIEYIYNNVDAGIHIYSNGQHYKISDYHKAPFVVKMATIRRNIHKAFDVFQRESMVYIQTAEKANFELRRLIPLLKSFKQQYGSQDSRVQAMKLKIVKLQRIWYVKSSDSSRKIGVCA